jgi:hypothetical protein
MIRKEVTKTTAVAATPMAISIVTESFACNSLSAGKMPLVTLCNGAGMPTVKLNASPVYAVTLVWTETTTVSSLTAA